MAKGQYHKWLEPDNLIRLEGWARSGLTDEQIAHNMGINAATLYKWKAKYNEIDNALKKNKEVVDLEVENALLKSAKGYDVEEITEELRFNREAGKYEMMVTKRQIKHIPASQTAQIFWLKNRKPKEWREKQEAEANSETLEKAVEILGGVESVID